MRTHVTIFAAVLAVAVSAGLAQTADAQKAERVFDVVFDDLVAALKTTRGCLGVDTAKTGSGKQVCFAWFADKTAAVKWLASDEHRLFMKVNFPEVVKADRQPLQDVPDDCGPLLMITSLTLTDKPAAKDKRLPLSQFSVEFYKPLKRGGSVGGGFAPKAFAFPAGRPPTDPRPVEADVKAAPKSERGFDEVFDDLMAAMKKHPGCLGSAAAQATSGKEAIFAWFEDKKAAVTWFANDEHLRFIKANFPGTLKHVPLREVADDCGPILTISSITFTKQADPKVKRLPLSHIGIELYTPLQRDKYVGSAFSPESVPFPLPKKAGKKPAEKPLPTLRANREGFTPVVGRGGDRPPFRTNGATRHLDLAICPRRDKMSDTPHGHAPVAGSSSIRTKSMLDRMVAALSSRVVSFQLDGHPASHSVQPTAQRLPDRHSRHRGSSATPADIGQAPSGHAVRSKP